MEKFTLSQEEITKALLLSPYSLSDSPNDWGLKAKDIKKYFYQFITYLAERLNLKLTDIESTTTSLEDKDVELENEFSTLLTSHDISQVSHSNLFSALHRELDNLQARLTSHKGEQEAHSEAIENHLLLHNQSIIAHSDIRKSLEQILAISQNAYSLAQGKSRIIPLSDVYELLDCLENQEQAPGDVFILEEKLIPDLIFYKTLSDLEAEEEIQNGAILLDYDSYALGEVEFAPGQVIIAYNKKLIGTESGVDLSRLATKERVESISNRVEELSTQIENGIGDLMLLLDTKESKRVLSSPDGAFTLENLHEYRFSTISTLEFSLPEGDYDLEALISFHSGAIPTAFEQPKGLIMSGDDCQQGVLIPVSNRIYEISIKRLMGVYIGKVSCCDYEVI